jgi:murein DD-endopeptidase MepM/ murein hydrolase activator NlpD
MASPGLEEGNVLVQEIARWLSEVKRGQPARLRVLLGAAVLTAVVMACVGCLVLGTAFGFARSYRARATERALARATEAGKATELSAQQVTAIASGTAAASETPLPTATPPPVTPTAPVTSPVGSAASSLPLNPAPSAITLEPMDIPGPANALELTPTTQLTLSALIFVENVGQFAPDTRFQVRGAAGGAVWLAADGIWITLLAPAAEGFGPAATLDPGLGSPFKGMGSQPSQGVNLKLSFVGANPSPQLVPFDRSDASVSYFRGNNPATWISNAPVWAGVRYVDLYPGVDLELTREGGQYVQRLVVSPGADLSAVRLQVDGAEAIALKPLAQAQELPANAGEPANDGFALQLSTVLGEISLPLLEVVTPDGSPVPASDLSAPRIAAAGNVVEFPFSPVGGGEFGPRQGGSDILSISFLGRGGNDASYGLAVDGAGSVYATGQTYFPAVPTTAGPFDAGSSGSYDAFVVKLNANGRKIAYTTFLGGSGDERGYAVAVDGAGNAYVTGVTGSSDLPTTAGAFDTSCGGGYDAFVVKVNATGTELGYATFLGGSGDEWGRAIAVDRNSNAYVIGSTQSANFPVTTGAWDTSYGGERDAFVVKVNALGTGLAYSTFLGGGGVDQGMAIAVDTMGRAYAAGSSQSPDFPTTAGAFEPSPNGSDDAFVVSVNEAGTALPYATFLGGGKADYAGAIAVDGQGNVYVAGATQSPDFPSTVGAFDTSYGGSYDAFVVKLNAAANGLGYAAFLGGSGDDWGQAIAVDEMGAVYVAGSSQSFDVPQAAKPFSGSYEGGHDAFVARVNELGTELAYATFLGGSGEDDATAIAVDQLGSVYVTGMTDSPAFAPAEGMGPQEHGLWNAFIAKVVVGTPFLDLPVSYTNFAQAALGNVGDRGPGRVNSWFDHSYPNHTRNGKVTRWDGMSVTLTASSPSRIGESWYDGHGGTDFRWDRQDEPIFAAAPGTVIDTVTICREGDVACGNDFGNRVWIDHGNGYATVYAHLKTVYVAKGTVISDPAAQPLGIMGNTGRSLGTHLHFGLYFDRNQDGRWTKEEVVDPYGWAGPGADPWSSPSRYLWKYPLWTGQVVGSAGASLRSPSGLVTATIPRQASAAPVQVALWDVPSATLNRDPRAADSTQWRSTGRSFWLLGSGLDAEPVTVAGVSQPITLSVTYRDEDMVHLDPSRLTLRRWDESKKAWETLPTTVDKSQRQVTARTVSFGHFDLHAPLLCSVDDQEPDDHYGDAQAIPADGKPLTRAFDAAQDRDWLRVEMRRGEMYVVQTSNLGAGVATVVQLRDLDSLALLASGESIQEAGLRGGGGGRASILKWQPPRDGTYLLLVSPAAGSAYGCGATYDISVARVRALDQVAVVGPTVGTMQTGYAFRATVVPITATQPITYTWQVAEMPQTTHMGGSSDVLTFTWTMSGTYHIVIRATNAGGVVTGTHTMTVYAPVVAAFSASPTSGKVPLKVAFTNRSTGDYTSSRWDFGDGTTGSAKNPNHVYESPGVYALTLTVSGPAGTDSKTEETYITVEEVVAPKGKEHRIYLPIVERNP